MKKRIASILFSVALASTGAALALAAVTEPQPQPQTAPPLVSAPTQPGKPAWLTPEKEAALVEVRKILREARQVAEGIIAPSKPRELSPPEARFTPQELSKKHLLEEIAKGQFRAGDFSASAMTVSIDYLAFAQLHYGQVRDAVQSIGRARLLEDGTLSFVYALAQAGFIDAAIEVAETQIKREPVNPRRVEASLFALIAREQARAGDSRVRESLQRARLAAKSVGPPNDRALSLVRVARAQRSVGDRAGSEETLREALDTALTAPRGRDAGVVSIIAAVQEENGDRIGSAKTFHQILEDEKNLKPMERARRLGSRACARVLRGHRESGTQIFQEAMKVADGLPVNERVRVWNEIGRWLVKSDDHVAARSLIQRIVETAKTISDEQIRKDALAFASVLTAKVGDLGRAVQLASMTNDEWREVSLFRVVAEKAIETNNPTDTDAIIRQLAEAIKTSARRPLPSDRSQADGRLADIAKIQAVTGDIQLAARTLERISDRDYHQGSGAYPEIIKLLAEQGNSAGARQIIGQVEKKSLHEVRMASALQSLGKAYAESRASEEGLQWARRMQVDFAKASILLGVAEGIMNLNGIENIVTERPEAMLQVRCFV
jgi:hypothetical protein